MFVDMRLADLLAEQKRQQLSKSYRAANRRAHKKEPLVGSRTILPRQPLIRRLLPHR